MMEPTSSRICKRCGEPSVTYDLISTSRVCTSCGCEQDFDNFQFQPPGGFDAGPQGTFVHIGEFNYKEKKRYDARNQINDVASSLGFSAERTSELTAMIVQITQGEYGIGYWFSILIAACAHVVMRKNRLPLSISEIAAVTGSDLHEIGRMVRRVVEFMDLKLPEFDLIMALDRAIRTSDCFSGVPTEKLDEIVKQGRFLLQCSVKWFLTTGRQPLPMVAAVIAFVAELNQLGGPTIDIIAKEIHAGVSTSRQRYRELKETLVKVAQALPWGKNVTVKNLVGNASSILQYMAMKSKERTTLKSNPLMAFDLREVANECLKTEQEYTNDGYSAEKKDSMYFEVEDREKQAVGASCGDLEKLKISVDCLSRAYTDFLNGSDSLRLISGEIGAKFGRKRKRGNDAVECNELWVGKLDLNKRLSLEQMINSNVGFDAFPPSFVSGEEACRRRKERIDAAKLRINEIIKPIANSSATERVQILKKKLQARKECKEGAEARQIDWEDCLIELLLLHRVKQEEIEQGNYKRLLDLYVFDSPFPPKAFTLSR